MRYLSVQQIVCDGALNDFDEQTDRMLDALLDMDDVIDPDIAAELATGRLDVQMLIDGEDELDAAAKAMCRLRAAIHAAGGGTPGWEGLIGAVSSSTKAVTLADA